MKGWMIFVMLGFLAVLFVATTNVEGISFVVDDDNGTWADYGTIQEAIDDLPAYNTVYVYNGTYNENVVMDKPFYMIGNGSDDTTVIGPNGSVIFNITAADSEISGLNITGGHFGLIFQDADECRVYDSMITQNYRMGIYVNSSDAINITNCNVSFNGDGIFLRNTTWTTIYNNSICFNKKNGGNWNDGIRFDIIVHNVTIWGNNITNNSYALDLDDTWATEDFWNITIKNNFIRKQSSSHFYIDSLNGALIANNTIIDGRSNGFSFYSSNNVTFEYNLIKNNSRGLNADDNWHIIFRNNSVVENRQDGIQFDTNANWTIVYNEFLGNNHSAIVIDGSSKNSFIHHNNFADNNASGDHQAVDNGYNNRWFLGTEGNWWSDWSGNGTYPINGTAASTDRYPLGSPAGTDAPEKVPEFGLLLTVVALFAMLVVVRRRR